MDESPGRESAHLNIYDRVRWATSRDVPSAAKVVLIALISRADPNGRCYPGQSTLATDCSMAERTVRGHVKTLSEAGLIDKRTRMLSSGRGTTSDEYLIHWAEGMEWSRTNRQESATWSGPSGKNERPSGKVAHDHPAIGPRITDSKQPAREEPVLAREPVKLMPTYALKEAS